jgi:hypothetical protein
MNITMQRWTMIAFTGLLYVLLSGCVATVGGGGYGYGDNVGVGLDYYEPYGTVYGGWGRGYHVGPTRGDRGGDRGNPHGGSHPYRSAPASHSAPSIPSRSRH